MSEFSVERDGVVLQGADEGEGTPVVLLHGLTATRRYVVMGSKTLERGGHRVVAYDARGHGRSSPAPAPDAYGYAALAADLGAVLDARGLDRVVLAGASMGAHTLLRCALDTPERVAGLVVVTPAYDPSSNDDPRRLAYWERLASGLREGGIEGFVEANHVERMPQAWQETVRTVLRQRLSQHDSLEAIADALDAVPRSRPFDTLHDLAELEGIPAVVVGSRDEADPTHPLEVARAYAAAIPGAELRVEPEGRSPLAWQGGQLSREISALAGLARI
ncbi:alpha/beta hydrolase [Conexibacter sp. JD483]|uniref:alpha/beta fold hydrolase n=1 Tax=unclassified Conexibacter TaxID=2627773 RepID=UPI00271F7143|nr:MULTISPECIES: alpha/beta hydrolase [unclassified Conexibacter]MDO8185442.1 alpha/beta hydrolase [Conexibacter sp. CPCC 205706]MDO8198382.1 alpha/beta hydrolase [Conexibacter sp. CPCC 205762]MDR9369344.1 alpha/beta hydrolase [Conexibacter sp. JD483]